MPKNILPHGLHKTCWLLLLTVLLFLVTLSAPYWVPHDPYLQNLDLALQAPNAEYPFGTDRSLTVTDAAFFRVCWSAGKAPFFLRWL